MRILIAHNRYQQPGGEDQVVAAEAAMLSRYGHTVEQLPFENDSIRGPQAKCVAALGSLFSLPSYRRAVDTMCAFQPDVLHVHNFMPTLSPSIFFAAGSKRVPVVQTLHNYRLVCANAMLFREGQPCEECLEQHSFLPGIKRACYRGSRLGSAVVGASMALHSTLGTWTGRVDRYIALTEFAAQTLGRYRLPAESIRVKPNFVTDHGTGTGGGGYALFVGRLSEEKGLSTLLEADRLGRLPLPLLVVGDGPMRPQIEQACARPGSRLVALGRQNGTQVRELMKNAAVLVLPSTWYEGFPMTVVEALSTGLPIIASRIGGLPEIVIDGLCGLLHAPGDSEALSAALSAFVAMPQAGVLAMRHAGRQRYLEQFSESINIRRLLQIYAEAIACDRGSVFPREGSPRPA